jgi:hypothetical protein
MEDFHELNHPPDSNASQWFTWLQYWVTDTSIDPIDSAHLLPGYSSRAGGSHMAAMFTLGADGHSISVVPDGYSAHHIASALDRQY